MKLTAATMAVVMIAAVALSYTVNIAAAAGILSIAAIVAGIASVLLKRSVLPVLILMVCSIAALISYAYATGSRAHPALLYAGQRLTVSGTVISNPIESRTNDTYKYILRTDGIGSADNMDAAKDTVLLTTPERLCCGDRVIASGKLKLFPRKMNENGFNTALYYKSQNIYTRMYSEHIRITGSGYILSPYFLSQLVYSRIDRIIYRFYYGDTAALISAVLTGNTHNFSDEYYTVLNSTALKRQLHPAYLHIWILLLLIGLVRKLIHKRYRNAASVIILGAYALISCTNIGFTRCLAVTALMIFFRQKDGCAYYTDVLARIFIFCVLTMPMIIFNVTFQLSAVSGLMVVLFSPIIRERLGFIPRRMRRMAAVLLIFAFGLVPIGSVYFDGFCIYALFAPIVTMPLVVIILILSPFVFLMLGIFGAAPIIGSYYDLALWLMLKLPYLTDKLPFAHILVPKPTPAAFLVIISLLLCAYYYMKKRYAAAGYLRYASLGLMLSLLLSSITHIGTTDFTFVNVGQGDGAVIHTAYGATVIVDGGGGNSYSDYDPGESIFVPYLVSKGYYNIDAAVVSHFHKDHVQGVIAAMRTLNVRNVFYIPPSPEEKDPTFWYNELRMAAEERGTKLCPLSEDTRISFDKGLVLNMYIPDKSLILSGDENNSSLLIRAEYGGTSALFTGDMSERAESSFMHRGAEVDTDVLKIAHHGSKTAASDEWMSAVSPAVAVISCGEDNTFGHPAKETLETLRHVRVLRTDRNGDIRITADKNKIKKIKVLNRW
ncbi:MAG: ComEC/Rec2 family competence protein [Clostridia bacterium]|nr:ComEC/Rec2 family competence protein [Clostridia bacterium]